MSDELLQKMNETLALVKTLHSETVVLQANVESLQRTVDDLRERLTYREKVLIGWKEIAAYFGCEAKWAQDMANESFDPLPVLREGGRVVAYATALDAYKIRRRCPRNAERRKVARLVPRESGENPS
jgi:hypothetical protein